MYAPSTLGVCEVHALLVEKSIASLVLRRRWQSGQMVRICIFMTIKEVPNTRLSMYSGEKPVMRTGMSYQAITSPTPKTIPCGPDAYRHDGPLLCSSFHRDCSVVPIPMANPTLKPIDALSVHPM
jgi:hypothetical protein